MIQAHPISYEGILHWELCVFPVSEEGGRAVFLSYLEQGGSLEDSSAAPSGCYQHEDQALSPGVKLPIALIVLQALSDITSYLQPKPH